MKIYVTLILIGFTMTTANDRLKRFLIFPPTSPTRTQIIAGIGVPVELDYESVTIGYVLKAEYYLPDNTTLLMHFLRDPFNQITLPISSRRRRDAPLASSREEIQKSPDSTMENQTNKTVYNSISEENYEKYDVEAVEVRSGLGSNDNDEDDYEYDNDWDDKDNEQDTAAGYPTTENDFSTSRWKLFKGIEMMAESKGLAGRPCMLRSICETAHAPFSFDSGILGELMHIIMTPSLTRDTIKDPYQNEYQRAEVLGRSGEPCDRIFKECTTSLLDQFSGIYNTMENVIKMFG